MPYYAGLKRVPSGTRLRTLEGLAALRPALAKEIPGRGGSESILLGTWNIREFDSEKYGPRDKECLYFIGEILNRFDLVAVQEVRSDLRALQEVMRILGPWWDVLYSDVTYGTSGNDERMAILYDRRRVTFTGLAGEVVLPDPKSGAAKQIARTPFICGFQCGWVKIELCTVHTYYGKADPDEPRRMKEIENLANLMAARAKGGDDANIVLLGDFNIFSRKDKAFKKLTEAGFLVPEALMKLPGSNVKRDKEYDQIAFLPRRDRFTFGDAGVFDYFKHVFREEDEAIWVDSMGEGYLNAKNKHQYYRDWRTYQMSDHLPMWVQIDVDHTDEYLEYLKTFHPQPP